MQTNTRQPREAVLAAFHHQRSKEKRPKSESDIGGLPFNYVSDTVVFKDCRIELATGVNRETCEQLPQMKPLEQRAGYVGHGASCGCRQCNCEPVSSYRWLLVVVVGVVYLVVKGWV